MITIHFDRMAEHAAFVSYRLHGSDAFLDMCRHLKDRGWTDQPAIFVDERGMACVTVRSIHSCARRYRPTEAEVAARASRAEQRRLETRNAASAAHSGTGRVG